jgi:ribosomal protein L3 glutamine methyltransferase
MNINDVLNETFEQLTRSDIFHGHGIDNAWDEAVALVFYAMRLPVDSDESVLEHKVSEQQYMQVKSLLKQRIEKHIPAAYLTNQAWFMGLPFYVDNRVLIPRSPFGEWIERCFQPWVDAESVTRILEIGTGSGCMAIAASYAFPNAIIDAVDISEDALAVAEKNVKQHGVGDRVHLQYGSCFEPLPPQHQYDLIISNPPYVSQEEIDDLPGEYLHEPVKTALYADNEGMAIVDTILSQAADYMTEHAILVVEVGYSDEILIQHYPQAPFTWLECEFGGQGLFLLTREQLEKLNVRK